MESETIALDIAHELQRITANHPGVKLVFKASFDKANRTSLESARGVGLDAALPVFQDLRAQLGCPVLTDVHSAEQCAVVAEAVDVLQIPAFLCRKTDLLVAAAKTGKVVNIKKGQFLSPWEMQNVVDKAKSTGNDDIMVCERGFSFGYNNLISDMRSLAIMRGTGCPVVFDATHSVQLPGGQGTSSGGQREFIPVLARAATAVGIAGVFMETHPDPATALSDGPNAVPLDKIAVLLESIQRIDQCVKQDDYLEEEFGLGN